MKYYGGAVMQLPVYAEKKEAEEPYDFYMMKAEDLVIAKQENPGISQPYLERQLSHEYYGRSMGTDNIPFSCQGDRQDCIAGLGRYQSHQARAPLQIGAAEVGHLVPRSRPELNPARNSLNLAASAGRLQRLSSNSQPRPSISSCALQNPSLSGPSPMLSLFREGLNMDSYSSFDSFRTKDFPTSTSPSAWSDESMSPKSLPEPQMSFSGALLQRTDLEVQAISGPLMLPERQCVASSSLSDSMTSLEPRSSVHLEECWGELSASGYGAESTLTSGDLSQIYPTEIANPPAVDEADSGFMFNWEDAGWGLPVQDPSLYPSNSSTSDFWDYDSMPSNQCHGIPYPTTRLHSPDSTLSSTPFSPSTNSVYTDEDHSHPWVGSTVPSIPSYSAHGDRRYTPQMESDKQWKDRLLVEGRSRGWSYKVIQAKGNFTEAESTLRGRYRALIKNKEERVRRPNWTERDVKLLLDAVAFFETEETAKHAKRQGKRHRKLHKIPWKKVTDHILENGGSYLFGPTTAKKKYESLCYSDSEPS